jgi:hypothetical protein
MNFCSKAYHNKCFSKDNRMILDNICNHNHINMILKYSNLNIYCILNNHNHINMILSLKEKHSHSCILHYKEMDNHINKILEYMNDIILANSCISMYLECMKRYMEVYNMICMNILGDHINKEGHICCMSNILTIMDNHRLFNELGSPIVHFYMDSGVILYMVILVVHLRKIRTLLYLILHLYLHLNAREFYQQLGLLCNHCLIKIKQYHAL